MLCLGIGLESLEFISLTLSCNPPICFCIGCSFANALQEISPIADALVNNSFFRLLFSLYQAAASLSENGQLLNFVLEVVDYFQRDSKHSTYFSDNYSVSGGVCEVLTIAFSMIGEIYSRVGASLPVEIWTLVVEVCVHCDTLENAS